MNYNIGSFKYDLFGGIAVAALSIPIAVAYAEIAGMPPESGLYTAVFALIAYFIFGSSRHVIIGTDFPTVTLFAAVVVSTFGRDNGSAAQFMMLITVMAGLWMFAAGLLRLGFIANFLSKPVLLGYLNGVSLMLIVSQLDKLTGIKLEQEAFLRRVLEAFQKITLIHWPTFLLGIVSILFLLYFNKIFAKVPAAIVLFVVTIIVAKLFDLGSLGIIFMPGIADPYPNFIRPDLSLFVAHFPDIFFASAAVMFVSYTSAIPVVRGFVDDIKLFDPNKEFYALGLAHLLIGFFGGYPVSADDSRTAVNYAVGGKTKFVNIIAALLILLMVFVTPGILTAIPLVTMAAIIAAAGIGMFQRGAGLWLLRWHRSEFWVFLVCVVGVLALGVYQGILFAIVLAILQLIRKSSKPLEGELVYEAETTLVIERSDQSVPPDDEVLIYRFGSALLFYNAEYFAERVSRLADPKNNLRLIVIDAAPINMIDLTALNVVKELIRRYRDAGVRLVFAGANEQVRSAMIKELDGDLNTDIFYPTVGSVFAE